VAKRQLRANRIRHSSVFITNNPTASLRATMGGFISVRDGKAIFVRRGETVDEFMVRNGVFDKLLSQLEDGSYTTDWKAELDELRHRPPQKHEAGNQRSAKTLSPRSR
jgi:hypothetical protein